MNMIQRKKVKSKYYVDNLLIFMFGSYRWHLGDHPQTRPLVLAPALNIFMF